MTRIHAVSIKCEGEWVKGWGLRTAMSDFGGQHSLDGNFVGTIGLKCRIEVRKGRQLAAAASIAGDLSGCSGVERSGKFSWLQGVEPADVIRPRERSIEGFNNLHAAAATRARTRFGRRGTLVNLVIRFASCRRGKQAEQLPAKREFVGTMAARQ